MSWHLPLGPPQEAGMWSELAEGHLEGWPGLCLAPHKCPGGMGSGGEFPLCQQQPRLGGGCPHCASREACKPVTKGGLPESSGGSQMVRLGLPPGPLAVGGVVSQHLRPFAMAVPSAVTGQSLLHAAFPHYSCHLGLVGKMGSSIRC